MKSVIGGDSEKKLFYTAMVSSVLWGVLAHGVVIFNKFSFHDELGSILGYALWGTYTSGRWAAELMELLFRRIFGGNAYSLQSFNAFVLFAIAGMISFLLIKLWCVRSKLITVIISGLMVTFPAVTTMLGYAFSSIYNELAYLLVVVSVCIIIKYRNIAAFIIAIVCTAFAIGIYQAVIPFMLTVIIFTLLIKIMRNEWKDGKEIIKILVALCLFSIIALAVYFLALKISLLVHNAELTQYKGIDKVGDASIADYISRIIRSYRELIFPECRTVGDVYPLTIRWIYRFSVVVCGIILIINIVQFFKEKKTCLGVLLLLLGCSLPLAMNFIYVMCDESIARISSMMKYSNVLIFVGLCAYVDYLLSLTHLKIMQIISKGIAVILLITTVLYVRYGNVCYLKLELSFTQAISYFTVLRGRIEGTPGYNCDIPVAYINEFEKAEPDTNTVREFTEVTIPPYNQSLINNYAWKDFMHRWIGYKARNIYNPDSDFIERNNINEMPHYPDDGSIRVIDDVLVVNF